MMKIHNRVGFHIGSNSSAAGWGEHVRALDSAGIPAVVMSVAGEGLGDIVSCWDNGSQVDHVAVVRSLSHNDVPMYDTSIEYAVNEWLYRYVPHIGNDVKKYHKRIITKHGNELDKNKIQWLADFYTALHPALLQTMGWESHRICVFNFSGGEPEKSQWESIIPFLRLAGENPDKFVIGVHEYSGSEVDIMYEYPDRVGRFQNMFDVCDNAGIPRPVFAVHEFGWRDIAIPPTTNEAMYDIDKAMTMYAQEAGDKFLGAGIWTLQEWQDSGINGRVQMLIEPIKILTLNKEYDAPDPVTEPPPVDNARKVTVLLTPQFSTMDQEEKRVCYDYQESGFLVNGEYTHGEHTLTPSHDDAFDLFTKGKSGSNLGIVYPQLSGYTMQWIEINRPDAIVPDKNIVFLQDSPAPVIDDLVHGDVVVDISYAQGNFDMRRVWDSGIVKRFVIRATSGKRYSSTDIYGVDLQFWNNVVKAIDIGEPVECYMFFNKDEPFAEQVNRFYLTVRQAAAMGLEVVGCTIDLEGDFSPQTESEIKRACELFVSANDICDTTTVYSGAWWWNKKVSTKSTWPHDLGLKQHCAYYVPGIPLQEFPPVDSYFTKLNGFQDSDVRYWQFTSAGGLLVNHTKSALDLNYYLMNDEPVDPPPPPPAAEKVNVLPYLTAVDKVQFDLDYGLGTQTTQVRHYPNMWLYVKGEPGQYERFFVKEHNGENWIFRAEDTSESWNRFYSHYMSNGGEIGAPWIPANMEVGKWYETSKFVQHYNKEIVNGTWTGGCSLANSGNVVDKIRLISKPYVRKYRSGKQLLVITLEWSGGEQYDYCMDFGNTGFRDATREFWFMDGPLLGRQDKTYQKPTCINIGW